MTLELFIHNILPVNIWKGITIVISWGGGRKTEGSRASSCSQKMLKQTRPWWYSLHKQENAFIGILLCGICTLSPLAPSPSILAQHSGYFLSYMVLEKRDSRMVGYLGVFLGSYVGQRKREQTPVVTDGRASSKGTPATCVSKAPCGLLTGDWCPQQDTGPIWRYFLSNHEK